MIPSPTPLERTKSSLAGATICTILIGYAGLAYMTAMGDPRRAAMGRKALIIALIALIITGTPPVVIELLNLDSPTFPATAATIFAVYTVVFATMRTPVLHLPAWALANMGVYAFYAATANPVAAYTPLIAIIIHNCFIASRLTPKPIWTRNYRTEQLSFAVSHNAAAIIAIAATGFFTIASS